MALRYPGFAVIVVGCSVLSSCSSALSIPPSARLALYEGLPHPHYETASLYAEQKAKPTIQIHGSLFYRATLELNPKDELHLKTLLGGTRAFTRWTGDKKCGGFHADYAVEWTADGQIHHCLICFGCGEVEIFGPTSETRYDIAADTRVRLKNLLKPYRKNRPPIETAGL